MDKGESVRSKRIRYRIKRSIPGRACREKRIRPKTGLSGLLLTVVAVVLLALIFNYVAPETIGDLTGGAAGTFDVADLAGAWAAFPEKASTILKNAMDELRRAWERAVAFRSFFTKGSDENPDVPEKAIISPALFSCAAMLPVDSGSITDAYAFRLNPVTEEEDFHLGIDIAAEYGTRIAASWPGTVAETGDNYAYGKYVIVRHSGNVSTFYGHCSEICVKEGVSVRQGETIARVGSTGMSTGPHVHFGVIVGGSYVNPLFALQL